MKKGIFILFILSVFILSNCTEDLNTDYKGKSTNRLIVDGSITTDTTAHIVKLSRTLDFNATGINYETGATVTISDSEHIYILNEISPGTYSTDSSVYGVPGKTYSLYIETSDGEVYEASSRLNPISGIDSIKFVKEYFDLANMNFYKLYFYGQEDPEPGQFYLWNLYFNDSLVNDTIDETTFVEDEMVNGNYISDFDIYWIEEDDVKLDTFTIKLEMLSIPEEYYFYLVDIMSETSWRGSPWDPMPANVPTNISNNAVGFFVAQAKTSLSMFYTKPVE